jgi:hypothetical protein
MARQLDRIEAIAADIEASPACARRFCPMTLSLCCRGRSRASTE